MSPWIQGGSCPSRFRARISPKKLLACASEGEQAMHPTLLEQFCGADQERSACAAMQPAFDRKGRAVGVLADFPEEGEAAEAEPDQVRPVPIKGAVELFPKTDISDFALHSLVDARAEADFGLCGLDGDGADTDPWSVSGRRTRSRREVLQQSPLESLETIEDRQKISSTLRF
jgi:hypothetical protein